MKYLKFFNNHSGYTEYTQSSDMILPNVSVCDEEVHVHYNPYYEPIVAKYMAFDGELTKLYDYREYYPGPYEPIAE